MSMLEARIPYYDGLVSLLKDFGSVETEKCWIWFSNFLRQTNLFAFEPREVVFQRLGRKESFETWTQYNREICVNSNKAGIERRVMKAGKAETVTRIKALLGEIAPR